MTKIKKYFSSLFLLSSSWLCCFSSDWFYNYRAYLLIAHSCKQCPLCNETWCANRILSEFIFSLSYLMAYIHMHRREQNADAKIYYVVLIEINFQFLVCGYQKGNFLFSFDMRFFFNFSSDFMFASFLPFISCLQILPYTHPC